MARRPVVVGGALILILLGASLFPASAQSGSLVTSHLSGESAAIAVSEANGGAIRFTTEARIGRLFDWELAMRRHPSILNDGSLVTTHYDLWLNSIPVPFILTYDGHGTVRMTLLLSTVATRHTVAGDFNELFLATRAVNAGSRIVVDNLVLDGRPVGNSSSAINTGTEVQDVLRIQGGNLADGFILTGRITMAWTGTRPVNSQLDFKLWGAKVVVAPPDTTPPAVAITAPTAGSVLATATPAVTASFSDAGSGIDIASVRFLLDGQDRTGEATVSASGLSFTPASPLADGPHVAEVTVRDRAGNEGSAATGFVTDIGIPALVIHLPSGAVITDTTPEIALEYSDLTSGLILSTLQINLDGSSLLTSCSIGPSSATCTPQPLSSGAHEVTALVKDRAGNTASVSRAFSVQVDSTPPAVAVTAPLEGSFLTTPTILVTGRVTDEGEIASVHLNGLPVTLTQGGEFQVPVALEEGANQILVAATDTAGNQGSFTRTVTLDFKPPRLTVESPAPGQVTNEAVIRVAGEVIDEGGLAEFTIQGQPVAVSDGRFETSLPLSPGPSTILVRALDHAGHAAAADVSVTRFTLPEVTVTSPADLSFLATTAVAVSGTVDNPQARVEVNGVPAVVSGTTFTAPEVPLIEGGNILTATAMDSDGHVGTASINVVRDLTAPRLAISYPRNGAVLFESTATVSGMVNDIVAGTVNAAQASVTVNGIPASVSNRSFLVQGVPLSPGENVLRVVATDVSGNTGEISITVHFESLNRPRVAIISGNLQEGVIGTALPVALTASLLDSGGLPVAGKPVLFKVREGNGTLDGGKRQIAVVTDASGRASAHFTLGTRAGAGSQVVEATAPGFQGQAVFVATAQPSAPAFLFVDSGNQQAGTAGRLLPQPLVAILTDSGYNRLEGFPVKFTVTRGLGHFANGLQEILTSTDSDGRAIAYLVLEPEEGIANNVVEARIDGQDEGPAVGFVASGRTAGDPADTSLSGVVLDNSNQPVAGVTLRILDTSLTAQTDSSGRFRITGAPVGTVKLIVDGSTADRPGSWPDLEFVLTTIPGRDNTVNMPIYLLPLDLRNGVSIDETRGAALTLPEIPGFSLEIAPGSITFPGGSRSGFVSVTAVHNDKVPMVPNFGQQPRLIVTIQPAGARFDPPARLTLPNVEGLTPGEVTEMYSFDHDLGHFVSIGPATVSEDGSVITSNPGVGILKAGWHCGGNPATAGAPHSCPGCLICDGSQCVQGCRLNTSVSSLSDIVLKSTPSCCTPTDPCETTPGTCLPGGGCQGKPVNVTGLNGPCVVGVGTSATFNAQTNEPSKIQSLKWTASGGTPTNGSGPSFVVQFGTSGTYTVNASCKNSMSKGVEAGVDCSSIVPVYIPMKIDPYPPPAGSFGSVQPLTLKPIALPCASGGQWCLRLSQLHLTYGFGIDGGLNIDVNNARDAVVTASTCADIIRDFDPPPPGTPEGPLRTKYWSSLITAKHEMKHEELFHRDVANKTFQELVAFANDPARCSGCTKPSVASVIRQAGLLYQSNYRAHLVFAERDAHDVSNPLYSQLIADIRARAKAEGWTQCQ